MERREGRRIKRRLTCEFFDGATAQRGIILDISPSGVFIRTNAVLAPGAEIDIHLAASVAAPAMTLRGCVVRRKSVPATLTTLIQPGLGVRILEAPREFGLLTRDCELEEAISADTAAAANGPAPPHADQRAATPSSGQRAAPAAAARAATSAPPSPDVTPTRDDRPPAAHGAEPRASKATRATSRRDTARASERGARVEKPRAPRESIAVLVGGSALDDVAEALGSLGVEVVRCGPYDPQLAALDDARLLVVTAEIAISDPIPVDTEMLVGIAVCGEISETMRSQIRQQGFRYLLRPQIHPEALRLLLRYAVYAERDRRGRVRHPVGCEVGWRIGWKSGRGRLLDISRGGCCLLVDDSPKLGASVSIKLPAELVGDHALKLRGKVLRATPHAAYTGRDQTALGIALDDLGAATSKAVAELCERWNESPPMLPRSEWLQLPGSRGRRADASERPPAEAQPSGRAKPSASGSPSAVASASGARPGAASAPESAGDASAASGASPKPAVFEKTRLTRRGVYDREIVQLDEEARVVQALLGRDLSVDGIRVARQLGLTPGDKLRLALFDASQKEPLMLGAEVCRDDGGSGLFLRFIDVSSATTARIAAIVGQLPAVEVIDPHGDAGVVPAEIISRT